MQTLFKLTLASIKMFYRNKQALFFTLVMPLIIMGIFGLIGFDRVPKLDVGLAVSGIPNQATMQFIEELKKVEIFELSISIEPQERQALEKGDRVAVFILPADLIPVNPTEFSPKTVQVLINPGQRQQASTAISVLNQILDNTAKGITQTPELFRIEPIEVNARNLKYIDFLLPGLIGLSLMQMSVFSVAFVFVDFKQKGILKRLLATPVKPYQFVTANVITRLIVALIQTGIFLAVGIFLFNVQVIGSYGLIFLISLLGAIMFLGLGFTISGLASTVESVPAIANLVVFPMFFLGGTFFPIETMPDWLQNIAQFLPLTYLSHSLREVMTQDASFAAIQSDIYWMFAWSAALMFLATLTFSFEEKRV
jgi:ABC-2 type transport system permease protein